MFKYLPSPFADQADKRLALEALAKRHPVTEGQVVIDPFGLSPLTAVICFHTDWPQSFIVQVNEYSWVTEKSTLHLVGLWGLVAGEENKVTLKDQDGLSHPFSLDLPALDLPALNCQGQVEDLLCLVFADGETGPIAYDGQGRVRWHLKAPCSHVVKVNRRGHLLTGAPLNPAPPHGGTAIWELDPLGYVYKEWRFGAGFAEDLVELTDGRVLAISGDPQAGTVRDSLWVLDDHGEAQLFWQAKSLLEKIPHLPGQRGTDPIQLSALHYDLDEGLVWVSAAAINMTFGLDPATAKCRQIYCEDRLVKYLDQPAFCQVTPLEGYRQPAGTLAAGDRAWHLLSNRFPGGKADPASPAQLLETPTGQAELTWQSPWPAPVLNSLARYGDHLHIHLGATARDNTPPALYRALEDAPVASAGYLLTSRREILFNYRLEAATAAAALISPGRLKAGNDRAVGILGGWGPVMQVDIDLPVEAEEEGLEDFQGEILQGGTACILKAAFSKGRPWPFASVKPGRPNGTTYRPTAGPMAVNGSIP
ncbi:aryl-sulfate sulfotransferase [Peptococcus simiae]|uniref:aryl-sulfate sulfotransferase n=1 Tax=Peptococcus simiae TaxID=1643805 RepID=UPI00397F2D7C